VPPAEHPAFYAASRFTLNVTRDDMKQAGHSPSVRLFEAAACATAIVTDAWVGLDTFFTPGEELIVAHTTEEVLDTLAWSPSRVLALGEAARTRVTAEHTAAHRASELEQLLGGAVPAPSSAYAGR
jgi:spore maturation protein CgeB